jgi:hypothetical protein
MGGLKAQNMKAQGNALGKVTATIPSPARASQNHYHSFVLPFQGKCPLARQTQGVALGYHVIALSARQRLDRRTH